VARSSRPPELRYWGKSDRSDPHRYHLLAYHMLDVAAVYQGILARRTKMLRHFAEAFAVTDDVFLQFGSFLVALHDLGKFAESFQRKSEVAFRECFPDRPERIWRTAHHAQLGAILWHHRVRPALAALDKASPLGCVAMPGEDPIGLWSLTSFHHHGRPESTRLHLGRGGRGLAKYLDESDISAAVALSTCFLELFEVPRLANELPTGSISPPACEASWWLAGATIVADWLGSNRMWFEMHREPRPLEEYWNGVALPAAARALTDTTLIPAPPSPLRPPSAVVGIPEADLRPMQRAAAEVTLGEGPRLFIVEDSTGSGKTEAAVLLIHRLLAAGRADGFYIALPTTATANAMYERTARRYRSLFAEDAAPSLVLAHSSRDRSAVYRTSIGMETPAGERSYDENGPAPASAVCNAWFADHPKKALLADGGVGTVDQALLAVLTCRHQPLRAYGLYRKVLVVDEVHAYQAYQNRLLQHLLAAHAAAGGSAVLLSATLPGSVRHGLVEAFQGRLGRQANRDTVASMDYPLLTTTGRNGDPSGVKVEEHEERAVPLRLVHGHETVVEALLAAAERGCAVWVRNTVADAVDSFRMLSERHPRDGLHLFHARFVLGDRVVIERQVLDRFGPEGNATDRRGHILVATQVVEQSLDLDFDLVVTDLAPLELVLQRLGRGRRHPRDESGNRVDPPDQRPPRPFLVFSPEPTCDPHANWLAERFGRYGRVYADHGRLWLTARLLSEHPEIAVPGDLRDLIEWVYGPGSTGRIPAALAGTSGEEEGRQLSERAQATAGAVVLENGYLQTAGWVDEETRTRLADPTIRLRLVRVVGDRHAPWCGSWRDSEVTVRWDRWRDAAPVDPRLAALKETLEADAGPGARFWSALPLVDEGDSIGRCRLLTNPDEGQRRELIAVYDPSEGLLL